MRICAKHQRERKGINLSIAKEVLSALDVDVYDK